MHFCGDNNEKRGEIGCGGNSGSDAALMAEKAKLLYIIVNDNVAAACADGGDAGGELGGEDVDEEDIEGHSGEDGGVEDGNVVNGRSKTRIGPRKCPAPRYTRSVLQSTLQLMGCKPRHALKISDRVFDVFKRNDTAVKEDGGGCGSEEYEDARRFHSRATAALGVGSRGDGALASSPSPFSYCNHCEKTLAEDTEQIELDGGKKALYEHHLEAVNGISPWETRNGCGKPANKKRASVTVSRDEFLDVVCDALAEYQYVGPNQRADLILACRVREKKTSVTVLLCGTSGCGKSTLSSLLASRLGITTVVSTDSIRHMMRSFVSEKENSLLWASTYHAGECLDPVAIAEAKIKTKTAKMPAIALRSHPPSNGRVTTGAPGLNDSSGLPMLEQEDGDKDGTNAEEPSLAGSDARGKRQILSEVNAHNNTGVLETAASDGNDATVGAKTIVVQGFKAQSEMVMDSLDRLITAWEQKNESVVVEGVHLSLNFVMGLMKKHPSIVPFMVYISNEGKHLERFAVRAKYMTLDPAKNKYVKYIRNIRTIQEYLCKRADKHLVPKVNNTNVDKSIAVIHATIFSCLRRRMGGEPLCDPATNTVKVVDQEYRRQYAASPLGSKGMFQLIQRRGSSRHLMALMNIDGSVAKAWPIEADSNGKPVSGSSNGSESGVGTPVYGPLAIGKSEPVNVRFGNFGLSAWPTDTGNASNPVSISSSGGDGHSSRGDCDLNSSCPGSSGSSSPKNLEAGEKELTEEVEVFGSDEEPEEEEPTTIDSNGESSDSGQEHIDEDEGGSVDDQSERSDEEYDPAHPADDGFWSDRS